MSFKTNQHENRRCVQFTLLGKLYKAFSPTGAAAGFLKRPSARGAAFSPAGAAAGFLKAAGRFIVLFAKAPQVAKSNA
jgi:hypothetical protein